MTSTSEASHSRSLIVQIATYNTNLQGSQGTPQDLVDWLAPTLSASHFREPPDIVAVGFQELLPLHLGLTGLSKGVVASRDELLRSQIEKHNSSSGEHVAYTLVAKAVNVGVALLIYARDHGVGQRICDVQTAWTGFGPAWVGNKGAVGIRFRISSEFGAGGGEIMTFVCAHLTAHAHNMKSRLRDWEHMVKTLLFANTSRESTIADSSIYATSHLFVLGDTNSRLDVPMSDNGPLTHDEVVAQISTPEGRERAKNWDQLRREISLGNTFHGLREGEFWEFPPSYKYAIGEVNTFSQKRLPAWTDRILYTTYLDSPATPEASYIIPMLYTTVPSYTTSDHKPVVALLRVPSAAASSLTPMLHHYGNLPFQPAYYPALIKKYVGKLLGWVLGWFWCALWFIGAGHAGVGLGNFIVGAGAAAWWKPPNIKLDCVKAWTSSGSSYFIFNNEALKAATQRNKTVVCATSASLLSTLAGYPLDSLKSRLQASRTPISVPRLAQLVWREEGLAGFFRGIWIPLMTISAVRAASFTIYTNSKNYLHDVQGLSRSKWSHVALSGATAGAVSGSLISFCGAPFELVKIRRQLEYSIAAEKGIAVDKPPGNIDAIKDIFRQHGTLGLYKGFKLHFVRDTAGTALYFMEYDAMRLLLGRLPNGHQGSTPTWFPLHHSMIPFFCGSIAGVTSWAIIYPLDVVKTKIQQRALAGIPARGVFETFKRMLRGSDPNSPKPLLVGLTRLYQGLGVSAFRSILTHGMLWTFFDWVGNFIDDL
ncbi:mitochondrial carrier protein [Rhizoctonia solani]|uniref:Mitochondrial carrier protein n=1 Tax=Rhizoctonia solani TaxID=456999 RepID=A0A8H8PBK3_9AGAM|nr:mitochondrial carrier protein [Rhizoctonia solani]QRW26927.1 mitochondrial carrier protein [Rhizoctonia solani]